MPSGQELSSILATEVSSNPCEDIFACTNGMNNNIMMDGMKKLDLSLHMHE